MMTIALIRQAKSQIIRVYLLSGQTIARIYFRDGSKVDANINAIEQNKMENGNLYLQINGKQCHMSLARGHEIDLELLYGITRPYVAKIESDNSINVST